MNKIKKILVILFSILPMILLSSCFKGGNKNEVQFWVYGTSEQLNMYSALAQEFNDTYGKDHDIKVNISQLANGSYQNTIQIMSTSESGPDVFLIGDAEFKGWIVGGYFDKIQEEFDEITDIDLGDIMPNTYQRLRYDLSTNTSNPSDPLYGLPLDAQPTALYYNETMFKQAGIIIISVDEENLDDWNSGKVADNCGVYKKDIPQLNGIDVPKKGYFRSINPYYYDGEYTKEWQLPDFEGGEICVFNNRISMNWDEVEDLAMLFSGDYNPKPGDENKSDPKTSFGTYYGYFTETWFSYGWSVGGDCLNDMTGEGDWNFTLLDPNPNYIVTGDSFTGRTGKVYKKGEAIAWVDKMNIIDNEVLVPDIYGDYVHNNNNIKKNSDGDVIGGDYAGIWTGILNEIAKEDNSVLVELPSERTAFCRYLKLGAKKNAKIDGEGGLNISPNPNTFNTRTTINYFFSGNLALLLNTSIYMSELSIAGTDYGFEWDIAPLVKYKEYKDPSDPMCDDVKAEGIDAGYSNTISMVVRNGSSKKKESVAFIKWCAGVDAQRVRAKLGFFPIQKSLLNEIEFKEGVAPSNVRVFSDSLEYLRPGDWWYMPDTLWVQCWCLDLNAEVRNGTKTFAEWYSPAIKKTNETLSKYSTFRR